MGQRRPAKRASQRKCGGDASRAKIGVAHICLRFAAGKMSGELTEKRMSRRGPGPVLGGFLPDDHAERQAVPNLNHVNDTVAKFVEEGE